MSKIREFYATSVYSTIAYNPLTGLYDILGSGTTPGTPPPLIASTIRIFNPTTLTYDSTNFGFFYISPDNKYIYLDGSLPNLDIVYLDYSIKNTVTNDVLYEINSGTSSSTMLNGKSYSDIKTSLSTSPEAMKNIKNICINFAYEQDSDKRAKQLELLSKNTSYQVYNAYNCNSSIIRPTITSPISGAPPLSTNGLSSSGQSSGTSGSGQSSGTSVITVGGSTLSCNSNNMDIKEYNVYYMYGLTFLNGLLIIISIALILLLVNDKGKK
jgi:hypothetical protein